MSKHNSAEHSGHVLF